MADTLILGTTIIEDKRRGIGEAWSIPGAAFLPDSAASFDHDEEGILDINTGQHTTAPVMLQNGVTITGVIVHGSRTAGTWFLYRSTLDASTGKETMATANIDTEDTSITNPIIDNNTYKYWLQYESDGADTVNGARIKFTI